MTYGARDIARNPKLLKIAPDESVVIEDKRSHTMLGLYLGPKLAEEFLAYRKKEALLASAQKIKKSAKAENEPLESSLDDGL